MMEFHMDTDEVFEDGAEQASIGNFHASQGAFEAQLKQRWSDFAEGSVASQAGQGIAELSALAVSRWQNSGLDIDPEWVKQGLGVRESDVDIARATQAAIIHVWNSFPDGCHMLEAVRQAIAVFLYSHPAFAELKTASIPNEPAAYDGFEVERFLPMNVTQRGKSITVSTKTLANEFWRRQLDHLAVDTEETLAFVRESTNILHDLQINIEPDVTAGLLGVDQVDRDTSDAVQSALLASFNCALAFDPRVVLGSILLFVRNHPRLRQLAQCGPMPRRPQQYLLSTVFKN